MSEHYLMKPFGFIRLYKDDGAAKTAACNFVRGRDNLNFEVEVWRVAGPFHDTSYGAIRLGKAARTYDGKRTKFFNTEPRSSSTS